MSPNRTDDFLHGLLTELCKLPTETEWLEFKTNRFEPEEIGEYISALSNSAALVGKPYGYLIWGVENETHQIVGTQVSPGLAKKGNEELESWLLQRLSPRIHFSFFEIERDGKKVVLLEIERAFRQPVQFSSIEYIRVASYKKKLKDFPEKERALWRIFDHIPFEQGIAVEKASDDDVIRLLDTQSYFDLLSLPPPETRTRVLGALKNDGILDACEAGGWNITNFGALLFAKRLDDFPTLRRKAMRVILYKGNSRIATDKEQVGVKGYASGFEELIGFVNGLVPSNEVIGQALRKTVPMYPEIAVREIVANALIHQDFFQTGEGPMVEIFSDRIEVTNPGEPLVATDRFLDTPPKSRNEALAAFLRRIGVCEERGSGIDKVIYHIEFYQLPPPLFEVVGTSTRAVLFAHRPLAKMDREERIRACYWHACLKYVNREYLTNSSIRDRFGIDAQNSATASRLIKEALEAGVIVSFDENAAKKLMKYVPAWAVGEAFQARR